MTGLNIELPGSLYLRLKELSTQDGISVEQFIATAVAEKIETLRTEDYLEERAKQGSRESYDAILAKVPDVEPDERDRWPAKS